MLQVKYFAWITVIVLKVYIKSTSQQGSTRVLLYITCKGTHFWVPCYLPVLDEAPSTASTETLIKIMDKFTYLYN